MKLLLENWRKYEAEVLSEEDELLSEGEMFKKLKDMFVNTLDAITKIGGGESELQQAMSDFIKAYTDMFGANTIGGDKYFHCVANCMASDRGWVGKKFAVVFSELREFTDQYLKGDPAEACDEDREANRVGQIGAGPCADRCKEYIPRGLPCKYIDKYSGDSTDKEELYARAAVSEEKKGGV